MKKYSIKYKPIITGISLIYISVINLSYAQECTKANTSHLYWNVSAGTSCEISESNVSGVMGHTTTANVQGNLSITNDLNLTLTSQANHGDYKQSLGLKATHSGKIFADGRVSINMLHDSSKSTVEQQALLAYAGGEVQIKNLDISLTHKQERSLSGTNPSYKISYGILAGTGHTASDSYINRVSKVTVENLNIDMKSTPNSKSSIFSADGMYQLSGIRVIRPDDARGSRAVFQSTGNVNIVIHDLGSGDYANGIYISGIDNEVLLNDSQITIINGGSNSAALRIGKGRDTGRDGGYIHSSGHMMLDTTQSAKAAAIRLIGKDSGLNAAYANSSSRIQSAGNAILYGRYDFLFPFDGENQSVALRNSHITTTSNSASLIKVDTGISKASLAINGNSSLLEAAANGWLIQLDNNSELDVTLSDSGTIAKGLTLANGSNAKLNMSVLDGASWQLQPKTTLTNGQHVASLSSLNLINGGILDVASNLTDGVKSEYLIQSPIASNIRGVITMSNNSYADTLTLQGDYRGVGGSILMNTLWNNGGSNGTATSDQLIITGQTLGTGSTTVIPVNLTGGRSVIDGSIQSIKQAMYSGPVILTDGTYDGAFVGTARTTGASELQLTRDGNDFRWALFASNPTDTPDAPVIYAPETPAYTQMPSVNLELGYTMLGTFHERMGEQKYILSEGSKQSEGQVWGRVLGKHLELDGKTRLHSETDIYGLQIGMDVFAKPSTNDDRYTHLGVYGSYASASTKFYDAFRTVNGVVVKDTHMGDGKTERFALGTYYTQLFEGGSYIDAVGEVAYLRNKYNARNHTKVSQNGYGALLSVEAGKSFKLADSAWYLEPQAQVIYQHLTLDSFHDDLKAVKQPDINGLRGRAGVRIAHKTKSADRVESLESVYLIANLWHDFTKTPAVRIGQDKVRDRYNDTWGELGVGMKIQTSENTYLYGDARYEHELNNQKRRGYRGTLGFNYSW